MYGSARAGTRPGQRCRTRVTWAKSSTQCKSVRRRVTITVGEKRPAPCEACQCMAGGTTAPPPVGAAAAVAAGPAPKFRRPASVVTAAVPPVQWGSEEGAPGRRRRGNGGRRIRRLISSPFPCSRCRDEGGGWGVPHLAKDVALPLEALPRWRRLRRAPPRPSWPELRRSIGAQRQSSPTRRAREARMERGEEGFTNAPAPRRRRGAQHLANAAARRRRRRLATPPRQWRPELRRKIIRRRNQ